MESRFVLLSLANYRRNVKKLTRMTYCDWPKIAKQCYSCFTQVFLHVNRTANFQKAQNSVIVISFDQLLSVCARVERFRATELLLSLALI